MLCIERQVSFFQPRKQCGIDSFQPPDGGEQTKTSTPRRFHQPCHCGGSGLGPVALQIIDHKHLRLSCIVKGRGKGRPQAWMIKMDGASEGQGRLPAIMWRRPCRWRGIFWFAAWCLILQGCRRNGDSMRGFENGAGKGDGRVKPMPRHADVAVLPVNPVNLHPVNKAVARPVGNVGKHQLPGGNGPGGTQFQTTNGTLNACALRCFQLISLVIQKRFQPLDKAVQRSSQFNENILECHRRCSDVFAGRVQMGLNVIGALGIGNTAINGITQMHEKSFGRPCWLKIGQPLWPPLPWQLAGHL